MTSSNLDQKQKSERMIRRSVVVFLQVLLLLFATVPTASYAVGFGSLSVLSHLGEPLELEIPLNSISANELGSLQIGLASSDEFARAKIGYPTNASAFKFEFRQSSSGRFFVRMTTLNPIPDTFIHFLLAASWSGGKVVREYTALLDPPLYSEQAAESFSTSATPTTTPSRVAVNLAQTKQATVKVRRGDTLYRILNRLNRPRDITLYQGFQALLEQNPDAFIDGNMNLVKAGSVLSVPTFNQMRQVNRQNSAAMFRRQQASFNTKKSKPGKKAAASSKSELVQAKTKPETVPGKSEPEARQQKTELEPAPVIGTEAEPVIEQKKETTVQLRIGQGGEGQDTEKIGDIHALSEVDDIKDEMARFDEALLASGGSNRELANRLKDIQKQVDRLSRLLEIEDRDLASAQDRTARSSLATDEQELARDLESGVQEIIKASDGSSAETDLDDRLTLSTDASQADMVAAPTTESTQQISGDEASVEIDSGAEESVNIETVAAASDGIDTGTEMSTDIQTDSEESAEVETGSQANADIKAGGLVQKQLDSPEIRQNITANEIDTGAVQPVAAVGQNATLLQSDRDHLDEPSPMTPRKVMQTSLFDVVGEIFGVISKNLLSLLGLLLVLLLGLLFYRRRQSAAGAKPSTLDLDGEQQTYLETVSSQNTYADGDVSLDGMTDDNALTVADTISYLSELNSTAGENDNNSNDDNAVAVEVDPITEADVYLAYDRDEQAIQVLKEAYKEHPEKQELALKLLEIFHKQDDRRAFDNLAKDVYEQLGSGTAPAWAKIALMGREVSPQNSIYHKSDSAGSLEYNQAPGDSDEVSLLNLDSDLILPDPPEPLNDGPANAGTDPAESYSVSANQYTPTLSQIIERDEVDEDAGIDFEQAIIDKPTKAADNEVDEDRNNGSMAAADTVLITDEFIEKYQPKDDAEDNFDIVIEEHEDKEPTTVEVVEVVGLGPILTTDEAEQANPIKDDEIDDVTAQLHISTQAEASELTNKEAENETETTLELAKAYLELGEHDIARGFIQEVINQGGNRQAEQAKELAKELKS